MGVEKNVGFDKFPEQGSFLHKRVRVFFNYDTTKAIYGRVVRDDMEDPFLILIKLDDNRYVRSSECQYQMVNT